MSKNVVAVKRILESDPTVRVLIEVEVPQTKRSEFDGNYRSATGEIASPGEFYRVIDNKWGTELRLYLQASAATIDALKAYCSVTLNTGIHGERFSYRINDNELIRRLFREGYRLGPNDPLNL